MDIFGAIDAASGSATRVLDVIRGVRGLMPADKAQELAAAEQTTLRLQEELMAARKVILALENDNAEVHNRLRDLEARLVDKQEYTLRKIAPGAFAYVTREGEDAVRDGPWYCQPCFDDGKKSVLQRAKRDFGRDSFECARCGGQVKVPNDVKAEVMIAPVRRRDFGGF